MYKAYDY